MARKNTNARPANPKTKSAARSSSRTTARRPKAKSSTGAAGVLDSPTAAIVARARQAQSNAERHLTGLLAALDADTPTSGFHQADAVADSTEAARLAAADAGSCADRCAELVAELDSIPADDPDQSRAGFLRLQAGEAAAAAELAAGAAETAVAIATALLYGATPADPAELDRPPAPVNDAGAPMLPGVGAELDAAAELAATVPVNDAGAPVAP